MRFLKDLLRSALLGFAALVAIGALFASGANDPEGKRKALDTLIAEAPERTSQLFGVGILGAIVAAATMILLRLFDTGPKTKILLSIALGPLLPVVLFAGKTLHSGKPDDLAAIVLVSAIAGFFAGLLEASRVSSAWERGATRVGVAQDRI